MNIEGLTGLARWAHHWGSTEAERRATYPCDALLAEPSDVCFRAVDVAAPRALAFAWLCQLRSAPYSYDWLDNWGRKSPRVRAPENERLARGQTMMTIFKLVDFTPGEQLTMSVAGTGMFGRVVTTYAVAPSLVKPEHTRLVVKFAFRMRAYSPMGWFLPYGDLLMMRKQLLTLKLLAEREHASDVGMGASA